ncbi:MAG: T9SS type A sorting domain-containing protein [Phaeodactylibacter sp.]|nr:T9SS type A sorting domain-containing protein [Phaeodactylibacter sp.]
MNFIKSTLVTLCLALSAQVFAQDYLAVRPPDGFSGTELETVDLSTGTVTSSVTVTAAGLSIDGYTGMAIDPTDGTLYVIIKDGSSFNLCTLDSGSGVATKKGVLPDKIAGITFTSDGTLYGISGDGGNAESTLFEINPADGSGTQLFAPGGGSDGEAIAYNSDDGLIYRYAGGGLFQSINMGTQATTDIATLNSIDNYSHALYYNSTSGNFVLTGGSELWEVTTSGTATLIAQDPTDFGWKGFVLADDLFVGTKAPVEAEVFAVSPNPATTELNIDLEQLYQAVEVEVYDLQGRLLEVRSFENSDRINLDVQVLPTGSYLAKINTDGTLTAVRFVKE